MPWRTASRTKARARSGGPHSRRTVRSAGGNERMAARSSRVLLALTMLAFRTAEASPGVRRVRKSRARSDAVNPLVVPYRSRGTALDNSAAAVTRPPILAAHTAAYGPPADQPITAKRSMPSASVRWATSSGQSSRRRPGWNVDRPMPGRSGDSRRTPAATAAWSAGAASSRELRPPWKLSTGKPAGIPVLLVGQLPPVRQRQRRRHVVAFAPGCDPRGACARGV